MFVIAISASHNPESAYPVQLAQRKVDELNGQTCAREKMMAYVLAIAGKIGSGKTSLTAALSETLGWLHASFGDYVRYRVSERGLQLTRENLQRVGTEILEADKLAFCTNVLMYFGWSRGESLVIDGLRHSETIPLIQQLVSPALLRIIYIDVDEQTRVQRLGAKGENEMRLLTIADEHSSEQQQPVLRQMADLIVDGRRPIPDCVASVVEIMAKW